MTPAAPAVDEYAEKAVLGSLMLMGDAKYVVAMTTRGLRPEHFYWEQHQALFNAAVSLSDRQVPVDPITLNAELDRMKPSLRPDLSQIEEIMSYVPAAGHRDAYADRVIELARWRARTRASYEMVRAAERHDAEGWSRAAVDLEASAKGVRTESYSAEQWGSILWEYFSASPEETREQAIPSPFARLNDALGGGIRPGEVLALSGPTAHGKSLLADQWLDMAAKYGKRGHLYMTEMTALNRGMRYLSRRTGVSYMKQRRNDLSDADRQKILAELGHLDYGCSIASDWDVDDIVRDALRARYDFVVVDLLHGFHYEDERGLDRLSKAMGRLAHVSTTLDGHSGTAVIAVTHLKEEGIRAGKIPRPGISSIKGGSSIKQDADFVAFVWQEQDEGGAPSGEGELYLAKGRGAGVLAHVKLRLLPSRFSFTLRAEDLPGASASTDGAAF